MIEMPVRFDSRVFQTSFNRRPFLLATELAEHPLLALPRLIELAGRLPDRLVEYASGDQAVSATAAPSRLSDWSAQDVLRNIEQKRSWLVLKRVEEDPEYAALIDACLAPIRRAAEPLVGKTFDRHGFIFVSSPKAVTPFHIDHEHNFLCQVRGSKTVHIWDADDRGVLSEEALEAFHASFTHRNLPYDARMASTGRVVELQPGEALHFPVTAPHWVQNGPDVSVSLSITFQSDWTTRREHLHKVNARLRKLGLTPSPVGARPLLDDAKVFVRNTAGGVFALMGARRKVPSVQPTH